MEAGCLSYAFGKQLSIPLINLGRKWTLKRNDDENKLTTMKTNKQWKTNIKHGAKNKQHGTTTNMDGKQIWNEKTNMEEETL